MRTKDHIDLSPYKDLETLLKAFRIYGTEPIQTGKRHDQYLCLSPFCKEKTPSCRIASLKKNKIYGFKDFGSGISGDVFSLVMTMQGVNFKTAIWIVTKRIAPERNPRRVVYFHYAQLTIPFRRLLYKTTPH